MQAKSLLKKIKKEFPELKWKTHRFLNHSWDHYVIILDDKLVFRIPKKSHYKKQLKTEIQLLTYLKPKLKVGIPEYKYVAKVKSIAGYHILQGKELTVAHFKKLTASEKEIAAHQIAEFITNLHATPTAILKKYHVAFEDQKKIYKALILQSKRILYPRLSKKEIQLIEKYFTDLKASLSNPYINVLLHNDLEEDHILWDSLSKQINIIDFSDRAVGDPAFDFTGLLIYGNKFAKRVFDLYQGKKDKNMLQRSRLYFKRTPLRRMIGSLLGFPCTFEEGYKLFKERF